MKCDVCGTNIPLGSNFCPNCGYQVHSTHDTVFDESGDSHNHIQLTKEQSIKNKKTGLLSRLSTKFKVTLLVIFVIGIAFSIIIPAITDLVFNATEEYYYSKYEDLNFADVIDKGYDEYDTAANIIEYRDDIIDYLKTNGFDDIYSSEYVSKYSEESDLYANLNIDCRKDKINYYISVSFSKGQKNRADLTLSGKLSSDIDRNQFYLKEEHMNALAQYLEINDAYTILKESHDKMKKEEDSYKYSNYDDMKVYMVEEYNEYSNPYWYFYYSIGDR